jgi:hypothetical protein
VSQQGGRGWSGRPRGLVLKPRSRLLPPAGIEYTFRITPMNNRGEGPTKRVTYTLRRPMASNVVASGSIPAGH